MEDSKVMKALKEAAARNESIMDIKIGQDDNNFVIIHIDRIQKDATITEIVKNGNSVQLKDEEKKKNLLGFMLLAVCLEAYENGLKDEDRERLSNLVSIFEIKSR